MADMGMLSFQTPEEVAAARRLSDEQQVRDLSKMSAGEWGNYGLLTSAQSMGRAIGAATGYVDPNEARAQKTQQVMSSPDSDLNTSKGMLAKAAELRTIDPRLSMQLLLKGRELEKQEAAAALAGRKQDTLDAAQLSLTKLQAAQAEKALRENPNLKEIEVGVAGKPDYRQKMIIDTRDPNTKPILVGKPYQIAAGVRVDARSAGGGLGTQINPTVVDYYAAQSLAGDNSWQVGLARGQVGQQLIAAVKDRIPQMAREQDITPIDAIAIKQELVTKGSALKDFTSGPSAKAVRSFNVAIDHLDTLGELAVSLKNNDTRALNAIGNTVAKWSGSAAPTNFDAAKQAVASEVEKAIIGGQTAFGDRKEAMDKINGFSSPDQLVGYISTMKSLMAGQLKGLAHQYKTSTGRDDFERRLEPKALSVFNASNNKPAPTSTKGGWGKAVKVSP